MGLRGALRMSSKSTVRFQTFERICEPCHIRVEGVPLGLKVISYGHVDQSREVIDQALKIMIIKKRLYLAVGCFLRKGLGSLGPLPSLHSVFCTV